MPCRIICKIIAGKLSQIRRTSRLHNSTQNTDHDSAPPFGDSTRHILTCPRKILSGESPSSAIFPFPSDGLPCPACLHKPSYGTLEYCTSIIYNFSLLYQTSFISATTFLQISTFFAGFCPIPRFAGSFFCIFCRFSPGCLLSHCHLHHQSIFNTAAV